MLTLTLPTTIEHKPGQETAITSTRPDGRKLEMTILHGDTPELVLGCASSEEIATDTWPGWMVLTAAEARNLRSLLNSPEVASLLDNA